MLMENLKKWNFNLVIQNPQKTESEYNADKEYLPVCVFSALLLFQQVHFTEILLGKLL